MRASIPSIACAGYGFSGHTSAQSMKSKSRAPLPQRALPGLIARDQHADAEITPEIRVKMHTVYMLAFETAPP